MALKSPVSNRECSIHYWAVTMSLFEHFLTTEIPVTSLLNTVKTPVEIVSEARVNLETTIRIYYLRHGFEYYDSLLVFYLVMLSFIAIKESKSITEGGSIKSTRSTLVLVSKGIGDQCRNFYLAEGVLRLICAAMAHEDLIILKQHISVNDVEDPNVAAERLKHIQSNWPVDIVSFADDADSKRSWTVHANGSDNAEVSSSSI
jgi:hypothetical protein